jgi:thioredoxin-like negative regulator of GroEL
MTQLDWTQTPEQIEAQIGSFDQLLVHFSSPACSVCHSTWPQLEQLAAANGWPVVDISIDTHAAVAAQRLVFTVPTILVLAKGKELLRESRFIGFDRIERLMHLMAD